MKLLLTGFEPFREYHFNSSWEAIRDLDGARMGPFDVAVRRLPVSFRGIDTALDKVLAEVRPAGVVAFGLAPCDTVRLERIAINVDWSDRPDNSGALQAEAPIHADGALALATRLPLERIATRLRRKRLPVSVSFHAGTYLCNHVFYRLLQEDLPAGFIHLPPLRTLLRPGWSRQALCAAAQDIAATTAAWLDTIGRRAR